MLTANSRKVATIIVAFNHLQFLVPQLWRSKAATPSELDTVTQDIYVFRPFE